VWGASLRSHLLSIVNLVSIIHGAVLMLMCIFIHASARVDVHAQVYVRVHDHVHARLFVLLFVFIVSFLDSYSYLFLK
jgi:hypothetical protein